MIGVNFCHKADEAPLVVMQWKALLSGHYMLDFGSPLFFVMVGLLVKFLTFSRPSFRFELATNF